MEFRERQYTARVLVTQYRGETFFVDVVSPKRNIPNYYEAWIYTADMGVKTLMFGMHSGSVDCFIATVMLNFKVYADAYAREHHDV